MKTTHPLFLLLAIVCVATSCRTVPPPPKYTMQPAFSTGVVWRSGLPLLIQQKAGVEIELSTTEEFSTTILCPVLITNRSTDTIEVDPRHCYYVLSYKTDTITPGTIVAASNPELMIEYYRLAAQEENKRYQREQDTKGFFALVGLVFEVAVILTESDEERKRRNHCSNSNTSTRSSQNDPDDQEHYYKLAEIRRSTTFWKTQALRRTTLYPGESVSGKLVFPMQPGARRIDICYPLQNDTLRFPLVITQIQ